MHTVHAPERMKGAAMAEPEGIDPELAYRLLTEVAAREERERSATMRTPKPGRKMKIAWAAFAVGVAVLVLAQRVKELYDTGRNEWETLGDEP